MSNCPASPTLSASSAPLRETIDSISGRVVDAAIAVHRGLGPGLLESVYEAVLSHELRRRGLKVETQVPIHVTWEHVHLDIGFRADVIVEGLVVVEIKSVEMVSPVHRKQLQTYLRLMDKQVGLLLNFNVVLMKDGVTRIVNRFDDGID